MRKASWQCVVALNPTVACCGISVEKGGSPMAARSQPNRTVERLEANRRHLQHLADACGEDAGLHKPLAETVGGVVRSIAEDTDLAQALLDRATSDTLVH